MTPEQYVGPIVARAIRPDGTLLFTQMGSDVPVEYRWGRSSLGAPFDAGSLWYGEMEIMPPWVLQTREPGQDWVTIRRSPDPID